MIPTVHVLSKVVESFPEVSIQYRHDFRLCMPSNTLNIFYKRQCEFFA